VRRLASLLGLTFALAGATAGVLWVALPDAAAVASRNPRTTAVIEERRPPRWWGALHSWVGRYGFFAIERYGASDRRHRLVTSGIVQLPGDAQVSAIADFRSDLRFNPTTGLDLNNDGYTGDLPAGVLPVNAYSGVCSCAHSSNIFEGLKLRIFMINSRMQSL
jgi:hypothetical protein